MNTLAAFEKKKHFNISLYQIQIQAEYFCRYWRGFLIKETIEIVPNQIEPF